MRRAANVSAASRGGTWGAAGAQVAEIVCKVAGYAVYADALNGAVSHYLDRNGLECDAVVHLRNGMSGLVEVKLGGSSLIEEGADTLNALSGLIDTSRQKKVAFKMVVTTVGDYAYQRSDGIIVCPLSALKP